MHIYKSPDIENYYTVVPGDRVLSLLDATFIMWLIPIVVIGVIIALIYGLLKFHDIPKRRFEKLEIAQFSLINILCLIGWVYHVYWIIALIIAFTDWKALENSIVRVLRRSRVLIQDDPEDPSNKAPDSELEEKDIVELNTKKHPSKISLIKKYFKRNKE